MAAVLACGDDAALSCRECAAWRGLRQGNRARVDVITPRRAGRERTGIDAHTSSTLAPHDVEDVNGIPCTTIARTLLDLAAVLPRRAFDRDRRRDQRLMLAGFRVVRFPEQQIADDPATIESTMRALLAQAA